MPELPEVEVICRALRAGIVGKRMVSVEILHTALRHPLWAADFQPLCGKHVAAVRRRGKYIIVAMSGGERLLLHLGMSGSLYLCPKRIPRERHVRVAWSFASGEELRLRDPRCFGMALRWHADDGEPSHLTGLGPEPLSRQFNAVYLWQISRRRQCPLKTFLLDQKNIAGIGNIYASEALFRARLSPFLPAGSLTRAACRRLAESIKSVLAAAIRQGGTTLRDHRLLDGSVGNFAVRLRVYGRDGQPCPMCGAKIRRAVQSGRSTYYCSHCQG